MAAFSTYPVLFYASYLFVKYLFNNRKKLIYSILLYIVGLLIPILGVYPHHEPAINMVNFLSILNYSVLGGLFYFAMDWFKKQQQQKELEKQNLQTELSLLKNQINPHFLFNTLNNIDSLIASDPGKASAALVGLSGMMRYMIYETNTGETLLVQELQQIENYLELQKIQYANSELTNYSVNGDPEGIVLAPMLFIPFVENAFKHCTDKSQKHAIQFTFNIKDKMILFESTNIADPEQHMAKDGTCGIGLDIVKRRLELLYPGKHQLRIDGKNYLFSVFLSIDTQ